MAYLMIALSNRLSRITTYYHSWSHIFNNVGVCQQDCAFHIVTLSIIIALEKMNTLSLIVTGLSLVLNYGSFKS